MTCRICNRGPQECKGYLKRVNEKGQDGIWECRPSCSTELPANERVLAALEDVMGTDLRKN